MPDILIFGMKMPTDEPLRIVLNPNGQLFVDHGVTFTEYEAIELPGHGDLIDKQAVFKALSEKFKSSDGFVSWTDAIDIVLRAQEIVPSNKEETE